MNVSVIVPVYNAHESINRCIEALLDQTYQREKYEVIVVDDGSTDGTADIIKDYPVKYIYQKNQGPAAARNKGAKQARGDIILFTDSDCVAANNWIEEMVRPFQSTEVVAVKGVYRTNQKSLTARFAQIEFEERFEMLKKVKSIDMVDTYSAAFRREIFLKEGGFDESFPVANNEDTELSYKISKAGYRMVFNPNALVYHLNHPDSIKKYFRLKFWRGYWRMVVYKMYPDKMLKDTYTPQTLKLQILFLFFIIICLPFIWFLPDLMLYPLILSSVLFILSCLPFIKLATKKDTKVAMVSPFFLSLRAVSIGLGSIWSMLSIIKPFKEGGNCFLLIFFYLFWWAWCV